MVSPFDTCYKEKTCSIYVRRRSAKRQTDEKSDETNDERREGWSSRTREPEQCEEATWRGVFEASFVSRCSTVCNIPYSHRFFSCSTVLLSPLFTISKCRYDGSCTSPSQFKNNQVKGIRYTTILALRTVPLRLAVQIKQPCIRDIRQALSTISYRKISTGGAIQRPWFGGSIRGLI